MSCSRHEISGTRRSLAAGVLLAGLFFISAAVAARPALSFAADPGRETFDRAVKLLEKGEKTLDLKALNEAQDLFEKQCRGAGRDAMCEYYLARVHLAKYSYYTLVKPDPEMAEEELSDAEHTANRAVARRPNDPAVHVLMGQIQFAKLSRSPVSGVAGALLGESPVVASYKRALVLDPNNGEAELGLGVYYHFVPRFAGGDPHLARKHFKRASQLMPNDPEPLVWLSVSYREEGRLKDARENLNRAVELDPSHPFVQAEAARLLEAERARDGR